MADVCLSYAGVPQKLHLTLYQSQRNEYVLFRTSCSQLQFLRVAVLNHAVSYRYNSTLFLGSVRDPSGHARPGLGRRARVGAPAIHEHGPQTALPSLTRTPGRRPGRRTTRRRRRRRDPGTGHVKGWSEAGGEELGMGSLAGCVF